MLRLLLIRKVNVIAYAQTKAETFRICKTVLCSTRMTKKKATILSKQHWAVHKCLERFHCLITKTNLKPFNKRSQQLEMFY